MVAALADVHARITCPVQLVWGEDDPFFPVDGARAMVDTFANARLTIVPDAKVFVHEERPEEVAAALLPTLLGRRG
jgi:pimeloyl-ACP methyl ester carboxylesterase